MPLTKVDDDTELKRQRRAASPSERGSRSERAPWSKARNAERMRQERAPSRTSSADAAGGPLSKKARALVRIRPFVHSFAASITAPVPAQQLKFQPLAFDDSSREAATASGLAIVKVFFENRNMNRSCAFAHGSLGSTLCLLCRSHRQHQKVLFVRGPFVGRDSFGSRRCGRQGTWKTYSLASFELPIYQGVPAPLSLSPALLCSLVLPKHSLPMCFASCFSSSSSPPPPLSSSSAAAAAALTAATTSGDSREGIHRSSTFGKTVPTQP